MATHLELKYDHKKQNERELILGYMKGKVEVHVSDIIANSGADKEQVLSVLSVLVEEGVVEVFRKSEDGVPEIVAIK